MAVASNGREDHHSHSSELHPEDDVCQLLATLGRLCLERHCARHISSKYTVKVRTLTMLVVTIVVSLKIDIFPIDGWQAHRSELSGAQVDQRHASRDGDGTWS
jgi:hypothetical protein